MTNMDLTAVSKSFGFSVPPFVDLPISNKPKVVYATASESSTKIRFQVEVRSKLSGAGYRKKKPSFTFKTKK